jgi:two-component sensor histidine kinase
VEKANEYQSKYFNLKDALLTTSETMNMLKEKNKYDLEKKEIALQLLEQQKQVAKLSIDLGNKTIVLLIVGLSMLALLTIAFAFNIRQKKIAATVLHRKNDRIETLVRELHHRVKNNLQVVSGLLALQSNRLEDENAKQAMDAGRSRVDAMALIHQKLYLDKDLAAVDIKSYLENLSSSLAHSYGYSLQSVITNVVLDDNNMDVDRAIPIGLIVNELVTNAFKHAFDETKQPEIKVQLIQTDLNNMELQIADNGKGFSGKVENTSFGMKLVQTLVEQLNGSMSIQTTNGMNYKINIQNIG